MFERLKKLFTDKTTITVYMCYGCGTLRTELEWLVRGKNGINCPKCGVNKYTGLVKELNKWQVLRLKTRYVLRGY